MGRFGDIERADELKLKKTALEAYRALSATAKQAAYAASRQGLRTNRGSQDAYIRPFGSEGNFFYIAKVLADPTDPPTAAEENETALITAVRNAIVAATGRASTTAPTGANTIIKRARKIQFSKVKVTLIGTLTRTRTSRFTGTSYTQREFKSVSCPFGAIDGTESEQTAQSAIRAAILATLPAARITFTSQGFVG